MKKAKRTYKLVCGYTRIVGEDEPKFFLQVSLEMYFLHEIVMNEWMLRGRD